jgi:hypothetical protein
MSGALVWLAHRSLSVADNITTVDVEHWWIPCTKKHHSCSCICILVILYSWCCAELRIVPRWEIAGRDVCVHRFETPNTRKFGRGMSEFPSDSIIFSKERFKFYSKKRLWWCAMSLVIVRSSLDIYTSNLSVYSPQITGICFLSFPILCRNHSAISFSSYRASCTLTSLSSRLWRIFAVIWRLWFCELNYNPGDGKNVFLRNMGIRLQNCEFSQPRRP